MITLIAAVGAGNEIGQGGALLWHLPTDMRFFKETTTGHTIIMGRKTFDSFHGRRLPNRTHVVISHNPAALPDDILAFGSPEAVLERYGDSEDEVFVIGGGHIYNWFYPYADKMYLTQVDANFPGADTFFPEINPSDWTTRTLKAFNESDLNCQIVEYTKTSGD